jgi:RNA polymerase sigma factor (sigma-70 family)
VQRYTDITADELLILCADRGDAPAWDEFLRRFNPLILGTAWRIAKLYTKTQPALCEDLAQQVYLKLNAQDRRLLREFKPTHEGASFGFLQRVTTNVVHDNFKGKKRFFAEELKENSEGMPENHDHRVMLGEIDDFLRCGVKEHERHIFWLHYRHGMTSREIASIPSMGLSLKGVESALKRVRDLVVAEFTGVPKESAPGNRFQGRTEIL